ncbi:hypothetical protein MSG28_015334 [Choristoneura fumiferana]|uniref:Uncharacterized protein n=1 Tax=Choristoneura fumiferana TaxID=7141 RepID=A0ACC0K9X2_CHOFU|nr:hypothetical protein MSG28_015334 [Choristoneura fumiferana]
MESNGKIDGNTGRVHVQEFPFSVCLWYPGGSPKSSRLLHELAVLFTHLLPAYLLDLLLLLLGKKTFMVRTQKRISYGLEVLQYYTTKEWHFKNDNFVALRKSLSQWDDDTFYTDIKMVNWSSYLRDYVRGAREYCCKEDPATLPRARRRQTQLYYLDLVTKLVIYLLCAYFLYYYTRDQSTKPIPLQRGVRQGDVISPKLFTAGLEDDFKVLDWKGRGINNNGEYFTHLRFADDIVVMAETMEDLSAMLADLSRVVSDRVSLKINMDKTKVMSNVVPAPVIVGGSALEVVDDYVYLGQTIQLGRSNFEKETRRIRLGWAAFGKLCSVFSAKLPQCLKSKVFDQCVKESRVSYTTYYSRTALPIRLKIGGKVA